MEEGRKEGKKESCGEKEREREKEGGRERGKEGERDERRGGRASSLPSHSALTSLTYNCTKPTQLAHLVLYILVADINQNS